MTASEALAKIRRDGVDAEKIYALPVVDAEDRLLGVITVDDAMAVLEAEASEDAALQGARRTLPGDAGAAARPHPCPLVAGADRAVALTVNVLQLFEDSLVVALALFVPLLIDTGENCGSQASTAMVRTLATFGTVITMQAFVRVGGGSQVVELAEVAAPQADDDEVVIDVAAFGVGIHDRYFVPPDGPFPYVIGVEAAGVVVGMGDGVNGVEVGGRVMVSTSLQPKGGTWAERVAVGQTGVTAMPDTLDFPTAAGIPVAGKSAVESVHTLGLQAGETLYVAGASGAIGTLVCQLAARRGVRVVGSASAPNHEYLRSLGAELAVDYRASRWPDEVRHWAPGGVDAALAIQPGTAESSRDVVRDGGRVVTVSGDPCEPQRGIGVEQFLHREDASRDMSELVEDIAAGRIRLVLEHVYAFGQALSALEKTETRHARGKVVVTVPRMD